VAELLDPLPVRLPELNFIFLHPIQLQFILPKLLYYYISFTFSLYCRNWMLYYDIHFSFSLYCRNFNHFRL